MYLLDCFVTSAGDGNRECVPCFLRNQKTAKVGRGAGLLWSYT